MDKLEKLRRVLDTGGEQSLIRSLRASITIHPAGTYYRRPRRSRDPQRHAALSSRGPGRGKLQSRCRVTPTRRPASP